MPLKEVTTVGLCYNMDVRPWYAYNTEDGGRVYWNSENIADLDEAITAADGKCDVCVNADTFEQIANTRPDIIVKDKLDLQFTIRISKQPSVLKYLPETEKQQVLSALEQGGFAVINDELRSKDRWDAAPNPNRSSC